MLNALKRLFASRKFLVALAGIAGDVLVVLTLPPEVALKLATLITAVAAALIGGIAYEDAAEKNAGVEITRFDEDE